MRPANFDAELASRFAAVDVWAFDLDNTLYPHGSDLWPKIDDRISLYLMALTGLDGQSARALQRYYYRKDGTTLRGLMDEAVATPESFLEFVHDIDRSSLSPNPALARQLAALPGRKLIFTNGSRDHATKTAARLGIGGCFEDAFDIVAADYRPKPAESAYDAFLGKYGVDPSRAAMFEDLAQNLVVPHRRGMATVLVEPKSGQADHRQAEDRARGDRAHVDFSTDDLAQFLATLNQALAAA